MNHRSARHFIACEERCWGSSLARTTNACISVWRVLVCGRPTNNSRHWWQVADQL